MRRTQLALSLKGTEKILLLLKTTGEPVGTIEKHKSSANSKSVKLFLNLPDSIAVKRVSKSDKI